jgi:hypothetical protein
MRAIAMCLVTLLSASAACGPGDVGRDAGRLINAVPCNASASARTFTLGAGANAGYSILAMQLNLTRVAANSVSLTCQVSLTAGNTWADTQECSISSGTCTSNDASWTKAVSATKGWLWRADLYGAPDLRCTFSCSGGGASDLLTINGRLLQ